MSTLRALVCSCLTLLACVPAAAQTQQPPTRPERPYRGIFASGVDNSGQALTAQATLSGGYDDNILAQASNSASPRRQGGEGAFGQLSGGLNYTLNASRAAFNAAAGTSQRYYPSLENEFFRTYNASIGGSVQALTKPGVILHQSVIYQPFTFLSAFPDAIDPVAGASSVPEPDFVPLARQYVAYAGGAELSHKLSGRTTFDMSYDYRVTDRQSFNSWRQSGGAGFVVNMTRDLGLRLGYRYTQAHYNERVVEVHRPDIGLDFRRALSLTRRTSLTFGAGTEGTVVNETTRWRVNGNASVAHEIGRSWSAAGAYQRGTYFVDTLSEPVYGDTASFTVGGLVTRRIQLQSVIGATIGNVGYASERDFDSYRGTLALSTALNRFINVGVNYAYYRYIFDPLVELEPGVPRDINRQSVSAQVTFWAPIFNKARRANASR
jgi:hypothetical protein